MENTSVFLLLLGIATLLLFGREIYIQRIPPPKKNDGRVGFLLLVIGGLVGFTCAYLFFAPALRETTTMDSQGLHYFTSIAGPTTAILSYVASLHASKEKE